MTAEKLIRKLIRRVSVRGTIPRGAASRVAEYLGASVATVHRWFFQNALPTPWYCERIATILERSDLDFSAKKNPGRPKLLSA